MATDVASADAEKRPGSDTKPKSVDEKPAGAGATPTAPAAAGAPATSLGERQVQAKGASGNAALGGTDDDAERKADAAADHVMRMPDSAAAKPPGPDGGAAPAAAPSAAGAGPGAPRLAGGAAAPTPGGEPPVRRAADPAAEQRLPGSPTATPAGSAGGGGGAVPDTTTPAGIPAGAGPAAAGPARAASPGTGPQTSTPAGPAPLVGPPAAAAGEPGPVETGTPAPDPEPPAPEGEAPARETPRVPNDVQEYLEASRGKGAPLPDATRKAFEAKYQRPFDDVRIHDDGAADEAARKIDALAFTRGNDIYFRSGAYDFTSAEGKKVLAHELAHIVQQRPGVNRKTAPGLGGAVVRRAQGGPGGKKKGEKGPAGSISGTKISIERLRVPRFKVGPSGAGPFTLRKGTREDNPTKQGSVWRSKAKEPVIASLSARIKELKDGKNAQESEPFFLQHSATKSYLIGTEAAIASDLRVPAWDKKGERRSFDIDHKREAQLGGEDDEPKGNLWLLDSAKNRSAGSTIKHNIDTTLRAFLSDTAPALIDPVPPEGEVRDPKSPWVVQFESLVGEAPDADAHEWWDIGDLGVDKKDLLESVAFLSKDEVQRLTGSPTKLSIFDRVTGGGVRAVARTGDVTEIKDWKAGPFDITSVVFTAGDVGKGTGRLKGIAFRDEKGSPIKSAPFEMPLKKLTGVEWGGVASPGAINYWSARAFSPITFPEPEFDVHKGIVGRGIIAKPSIKLLENVEFAVVFDGDVGIEATVAGGALKLPGPFKVLGGSLTLSAGTGGVAVKGDIEFEIGKLAKGRIGAGARAGSESPSLWLEGELNFDTKMFTKAGLGLSYKDGKWGVKGELEIGPDKVKGIKNASAKVEVNDDTVTATGAFETSLKGVDKGTVGFRYNEATGMEITGEIILGKGIPGIKSGKLGATVKEGKEGWSLSGDVTLEPSVPGLTGTVTGRYEDGAFLVEADLGYERGLAKGSVKLGLTNQAVGPEGKPAGPPRRDGALTAYGEGTVVLTITPWLKGTVGLKLKPNGEIEVRGEVALPPTFDVFEEKKVERKVFSIGIDIPIVGVAVAGQRIGIFATIRGGLNVSAGFGPGQLRDVALKVAYNPDRPDDTTVTGTGTFYVPARAGLRLTVDGGLGAGIPVVSATAGVSIYGEVGVAGAASAGAVVNWSPRTGIVMDATGQIFVEPKFTFGIDAFVDVSADLWLTTIELYHKTWKLASFEYGSNMRFGLTFPLHYESGKPFELSFDQIQWTYPQIEPSELLGGLMKQLVG